MISSIANVKGLEIAREHNIPSFTIPRKCYRDDDAFSQALTSKLEQFDPDLIVFAGFLHFYRLPKKFLGKTINIHPALLPSFGGKGFYGERVHKAVLHAGVKESGCTVHFVDNQYDHGPIILQRRVPVLENDTPETLAERVFAQECILYPQVIKLFAEGKIKIPESLDKISP